MTEQAQAGAVVSARDEFERAVAQKASQDPDFKRRLLANPKEALKAAFGVEIPKDVAFQVLEETPSRFYLVLPVAMQELSDEDLEKAAGGLGSAAAAAASPGSLQSYKEAFGFKLGLVSEPGKLEGKLETGFLK
jgi:hypothetical protein